MLFACPATDDFFRSRIDHMIDLRHPLAVLSSRMPWQEIEARVAQVFSRKGRTGVAMPDLDLFGEQVQRTVVASNAGRPRVPLRIMIALLYLKHAFNESDEGVVERWGETPSWQFFSGRAYFEHHRPCDATTLIKFRQLLSEEGVEELLAQTINVAVDLKLIKPQELARVIVDSTVQHKAIAHPTDSRLLETARAKLVEAAKDVGIELKQTFAKEGQHLSHKAGRYAHARQFKRMRRAIKRQRTIIGHLKADHRMDRCHLKGELGDRLHAVLCAAGFNIKWLLRMIVRKGVSFRRVIFLCLQQAPSQGRSWLGSVIAQTLTTASSWRPTRRSHAICRWLAIDVLAAA